MGDLFQTERTNAFIQEQIAYIDECAKDQDAPWLLAQIKEFPRSNPFFLGLTLDQISADSPTYHAVHGIYLTSAIRPQTRSSDYRFLAITHSGLVIVQRYNSLSFVDNSIVSVSPLSHRNIGNIGTFLLCARDMLKEEITESLTAAKVLVANIANTRDSDDFPPDWATSRYPFAFRNMRDPYNKPSVASTT